MRKIPAVIAAAALLFTVFGCKAKEGAESKTIENLKAAITGETTASVKYAAYAKKAKEEGFNSIALLFETASKGEAIHAAKHTAVLAKLGGKMDAPKPQFQVKSTKENLEDAVKGEGHEITSMYPDFIKTATGEKKDDAVNAFTQAMEVEKIHLAFYKKALEALGKKDDKSLGDVWSVCPECGNAFDKNAPANCPICGVAKAKFIGVK